jgi:vacuolar-type H+-ATPase subunit D/Vma8
LIPTAKEHIKRIQIYLGDLERDAVVRSKLAKGRSLAAQQASAEVGP